MSGRKRFCAKEAAARLQLLMEDSISSGESEDESCDDVDDKVSSEMRSSDTSECDTSDNEGNNTPACGDQPEDFVESSSSSAESEFFEDSNASETHYKALSGRVWNDVPPPTSRTRSANLFTASPGPSVDVHNEKESMSQFITDEILNDIIKWTNKYGQKNCKDWFDITLMELNA